MSQSSDGAWKDLTVLLQACNTEDMGLVRKTSCRYSSSEWFEAIKRGRADFTAALINRSKRRQKGFLGKWSNYCGNSYCTEAGCCLVCILQGERGE